MIDKKTVSSRIFIFAALILAIFFGNLKYKQWQGQRKIEQEKNKLEVQADELQKKNNELNESLKYLNSPNFKERVAREQLGLKKSGETVYGFADAPDSGQQTEAAKKTLNIEKWWSYFFPSET